jgi:hypothetical protein
LHLLFGLATDFPDVHTKAVAHRCTRMSVSTRPLHDTCM